MFVRVAEPANVHNLTLSFLVVPRALSQGIAACDYSKFASCQTTAINAPLLASVPQHLDRLAILIAHGGPGEKTGGFGNAGPHGKDHPGELYLLWEHDIDASFNLPRVFGPIWTHSFPGVGITSRC